MRKIVLIVASITGLLFLTTFSGAKEIVIDLLCGEIGHAPCVPGFNAPLPEKKTFDAARVETFGEPSTVLDGAYSIILPPEVKDAVDVVVKLLPYSQKQQESEVYRLERKHIRRAAEDPDLGGEMSADVFELALKRNGDPVSGSFVKPIFLTLPWPSDSYLKKTVHVWNGSEWAPLPSTSDFDEKTVTAPWHLPYGQFAVFEDAEVFEGVASWYANKDCNCAAIKEYKRGMKFKVTNITDGSPRYGRSVNVTINDYGPAVWTKRAIDLDKVAFSQIARTWNGLATVRVERIQ